MAHKIDYSTYTNEELQQAFNSIDRIKYNDTFEELKKEMLFRETQQLVDPKFNLSLNGKKVIFQNTDYKNQFTLNYSFTDYLKDEPSRYLQLYGLLMFCIATLALGIFVNPFMLLPLPIVVAIQVSLYFNLYAKYKGATFNFDKKVLTVLWKGKVETYNIALFRGFKYKNFIEFNGFNYLIILFENNEFSLVKNNYKCEQISKHMFEWLQANIENIEDFRLKGISPKKLLADYFS